MAQLHAERSHTAYGNRSRTTTNVRRERYSNTWIASCLWKTHLTTRGRIVSQCLRQQKMDLTQIIDTSVHRLSQRSAHCAEHTMCLVCRGRAHGRQIVVFVFVLGWGAGNWSGGVGGVDACSLVGKLGESFPPSSWEFGDVVSLAPCSTNRAAWHLGSYPLSTEAGETRSVQHLYYRPGPPAACGRQACCFP